ncbi:MAG: DEAD/DEAH box helicase family protein [Parvibaculum sp.]|uniref:DEAD/DEAH box helicase n=1 Tax=Parvibaculum sp. TaxID=2024848 RepID=UPI0025E3F252|nr:DEAD/DEAH box helicase family protein [Parvibaculum sp.]MCE9650298.1 DEAD/DEAH box helicase family protein [Parvibaculum sp.]
MELKDYQKDTLATLGRFFREARVSGPAAAYKTIVDEPDHKARLGRFAGDYRSLDAVPNAPYICLRLPTGGGKTLLAAHSVAVARDAWIEREHPLVLWLVPTNTIRLQTVDALKNTRHAYRRALDEAFEGRVRIFDIADFPTIRPQDLRGQTCVVVGTIQTLRVANTEGRKVYAHHEDLESHFSAVPPNTPGLERSEDGPNKGRIKFSFANLMHLHRPLMIVDEAHNAVTGLTRDLQERVNPCAIIEFTATPKLNSNILHSVGAQELKREEMIKLPIVLAEHADWQSAVSGTIASRAALAEKALLDTEGYIRPIVLFQAQPKDEDVTVEVLKKHLIENENIPEEKIAVATGDQRELDAIDLFDPKTKIEYIITVEALKEGWDCSFAYVFCSVSRIRSATAVEQLLGRVLRMPYAKRRALPELNKAYAHIAEPSFAEAAKGLVDRLVDMGFDDSEARENIESEQYELGDDDLFVQREKTVPAFRQTIEGASPEAVEALRKEIGTDASVTLTEEGKVEIAVPGYLPPGVEAAIAKAMPAAARGGFAEAAKKYRSETHPVLSPAERREDFVAPALTAWVQDEFLLADTDTLMEEFDWSLLDAPAVLSESEFSIRESAMEFQIDLDGRKLAYSFVNEQDRLLLDVPVENWTEGNLVVALDRQVRQADITPSELIRWLRDTMTYLTKTRGIAVSALWRAKYPLAQKLEAKIKSLRQRAREKAYQLYLFAPEAKVGISFDNGFRFDRTMYADVRKHRGGAFRFRKHFLGPDKVPAFSGKQGDGGEEFQCAQMIDSLDEVEFWIRNVAQHPASFRLPVASGNFYPDFVAKLKDGRIFVIEYKGALLAGAGNDDTNEKRLVGELWARASNGRGLFAVIEKEIDGRDMRGQLLDHLAGKV